MGLLDKLKNTFFEEEYVEVEELEKPKKDKKPSMKPLARKVEPEIVPEIKPVVKEIIPVVEEDTEILTERELTRRETSFKYFEDDDFIDVTADDAGVHEVEKKPYGGSDTKLYDNPAYGTVKPSNSSPYSKVDTKQGFKPTPIISPIYGVLDKNYKKEEVIDKKEIRPTSSYVSRKNADLDSVRQKAYGELSHDLGLSSYESSLTEVDDDEDDKDLLEDNLLYDMNDLDTTPTVEKVTLADAEEYFQDLGLEYNIDYKDIKYEKATGRRVRPIPVIDEMEEEIVVRPVDVSADSSVEKNDDKLEDNLFDLIDSMYEEKE